MDILNHPALYTDYYELTMAQGYYLFGKAETPAAFDYFYRDNPFNGGYAVFAGLGDLIPLLENFRFHSDELDYLKSRGFHSQFLRHLKTFRFRGNIFSVREGEVVFPLETLLRAGGTLMETQLIETLLVNILNFQSLIATKASRIRRIAGDRTVVDFGLRRAQGAGGIQASRAAVIGGVNATSNVYAAFLYGLTPSGTQAHSWIQSFGDELNAFRAFVELYPGNCVLLVDTYNTLTSGVPNAITVAKEMEGRGQRLLGIRLDSGDLAYLSKKTRKMLDDNGLYYVKIAASNQLDEYIIKSLNEQNAPIDIFGVGTRLVTGHDCPALDGVYKMCMAGGKPTLKISDNIAKVNLPGLKQTHRFSDREGNFACDAIALDTEKTFRTIHHPHFPGKTTVVRGWKAEKLLRSVMHAGEQVIELPGPEDCSAYLSKRITRMPGEHLRFENPHIYKVGITPKLVNLRKRLLK